MKNIAQDAFLSIRIPVPPLAEQRKISAILGTWDAAISTVEKLVAALQERKRGLMQRLLTGKVRFPECDGVWEEMSFSDLLDLEIGGTPSRANPSYWDVRKATSNRWLSIADLSSKYISDSKEYLSDHGVKNSSTRLFPAGTVIMSFKLTIGRAAILAKPCYTNEAICALIPRDAAILSSEYLYHALSVVNFEQEMDQAVKGRTLNKAKLKRLKLLVPPHNEQKTLADFFDLVDTEISVLHNYKRQLQAQKQGLMQRLLTGQVRVRVDEDEGQE